ncbi:hypothetical protein ACS7SF_02980 [Ralstonia sp. 25C]|uniref:hypothetical protein n=1 Tax=Ralstonia sp. 25C TaxID=3447363 RepID=UPI003F7558D7
MSTTKYPTAKDAAKAMSAAMVSKTDRSGATVRLTDSAPQWMHDTVRKIHDAREFDDSDNFKYETIHYYLNELAEYEESEWDTYDLDAIWDSFGDEGSYQWLRTSFYRLNYLDEVRKAPGSGNVNMLSLLNRAQMLEHREIFTLLVAAVRAQVQAKAPAAKRTTKKTKAAATA